MDDGLQHPGLEKTASLLVIDGAVGFGNGRVMPAGPLREPAAAAAARCRAAILIGADQTAARAAIDGLPVLDAWLVPDRVLAPDRVFAFLRHRASEQILRDGCGIRRSAGRVRRVSGPPPVFAAGYRERVQPSGRAARPPA